MIPFTHYTQPSMMYYKQPDKLDDKLLRELIRNDVLHIRWRTYISSKDDVIYRLASSPVFFIMQTMMVDYINKPRGLKRLFSWV